MSWKVISAQWYPQIPTFGFPPEPSSSAPLFFLTKEHKANVHQRGQRLLVLAFFQNFLGSSKNLNKHWNLWAYVTWKFQGQTIGTSWSRGSDYVVRTLSHSVCVCQCYFPEGWLTPLASSHSWWPPAFQVLSSIALIVAGKENILLSPQLKQKYPRLHEYLWWHHWLLFELILETGIECVEWSAPQHRKTRSQHKTVERNIWVLWAEGSMDAGQRNSHSCPPPIHLPRKLKSPN